MKTLSRVFAVLLACMLATPLVACGGSGNEEKADDQAATQTTEQEAEQADDQSSAQQSGDDQAINENIDQMIESTDSKATTDSSEGTKAETQQEAQSDEGATDYAAGTIDGSTYTSEFFGITYTLPEGYQFATDEQIEQLGNAVVDMSDSEKVTQALESGQTLMEMYAFDSSLNSINMTVENANAIAATLIDAEGYRDITEETLPDDLGSVGFTDVVCEKTTYSINGTEHPALDISAMNQGVPIYEKLIVLKRGNYFLGVCVASASQDAIPTILSGLG